MWRKGNTQNVNCSSTCFSWIFIILSFLKRIWLRYLSDTRCVPNNAHHLPKKSAVIGLMVQNPTVSLLLSPHQRQKTQKSTKQTTKDSLSRWVTQRQWNTKSQGAHAWQTRRVSEVKRNFSSASHLTRVSSTLLIRNTLIISSLPAALSECSGQMTSVENIDLNGNACTSLSKSGAPPSVQENNTLFCCSLGKCHYTSCLRPDAHRSHSAGC